MGIICLASADKALLQRWQSGVSDLGTITPIPSLNDFQVMAVASELCLVDCAASHKETCTMLLSLAQSYANTAFVVMVAEPNVEDGIRLLQAGCKGYANRLIAPNMLNTLVKSVQGGEIWAGKKILSYLVNHVLAGPPRPHPDKKLIQTYQRLTKREIDIVERITMGHNNKRIARDFTITERTVKAHVTSILHKTGANDRLHLALQVKDLISLDELRRAKGVFRSN